MSQIKDLQPRLVWEIFDEITRIPRPSKHEERIREYLVTFAEKHNIDYACDAIGNVVMRKGATAGCETKPTIILQAHMDMVCEKNADVEFDFERDAIRTYIDNGWVRAEGTTLGADDGIGVAAALAVLVDETLEHGPIEALFTVDEETGLTGAFHLGDNMISGKYLINLDSEDEGEVFIGCAGGVDTVATMRYHAEAAPAEAAYFRLDVTGLCGGHSGDDIDKGLANSNKLAARFILAAEELFGARLSHFDGGNLRNAIPREAHLIFGVERDKAAQLEAFATRFSEECKAEFTTTEPNMRFTLSTTEQPQSVMDTDTQHRLLIALVGVPNGVLAMSAVMPGLVETSTNLASVKFCGDEIIITTSQRSSVESAKEYAKRHVEAIFVLAGCMVTHSDGYPGWSPNPQSTLLEWTKQSYFELFGVKPKVRAIHAGLECGLFLSRYPHLEMVSFGPTLRGVHSPDERLDIASVDKFWLLLTSLLRRAE